jgi:hypothetical protein
MDIGQIITIYVKALTNEEWLGAWAPVRAELLWHDPETDTGLFRLVDNDLEEDDEYEYYQADTLVLARRAEPEGDFRVEVGLAPLGAPA